MAYTDCCKCPHSVDKDDPIETTSTGEPLGCLWCEKYGARCIDLEYDCTPRRSVYEKDEAYADYLYFGRLI